MKHPRPHLVESHSDFVATNERGDVYANRQVESHD